ncbi:hypothetical protein BBP40_001984 [Aspergillus hancockii]|nr:hypothetical protein BBP40_001984 [Aspergillus hancockii]
MKRTISDADGCSAAQKRCCLQETEEPHPEHLFGSSSFDPMRETDLPTETGSNLPSNVNDPQIKEQEDHPGSDPSDEFPTAASDTPEAAATIIEGKKFFISYYDSNEPDILEGFDFDAFLNTDSDRSGFDYVPEEVEVDLDDGGEA